MGGRCWRWRSDARHSRPIKSAPASRKSAAATGRGFWDRPATASRPSAAFLTHWPADGSAAGLALALGTGYCMPAVASGRLFQFDRVANQARLRSLESETGKPLWTFEYPQRFQDLYGYDNGPRCSPVVDGDRVYIFGAEGMLHCLARPTASCSGRSTPRPSSA